MPPRHALSFAVLLAVPLLAGAHAAAATDSLMVRHTARYDLYATTSAQLDTSAHEIEHAVDIFNRCFGEPPPRIAVVVLASPDDLRHLDLKRYRVGGIPVLPWVTTSYLASGERNVSVNLELGVVLSWSAEGGLRVVSPLPRSGGDTTHAAGGGLQAGDVIRSLDGVPVASLKGFEDRFGALAPGTDATLEIGQGASSRSLRVRKQATPEAPRRAGVGGAEKALSHEVGHMLLMAWVDARLGRTDSTSTDTSNRPSHYGSDTLPDWLDEAFATLCEFPALQASRRALMRDSLSRRIPFTQLFTMPHPVAASQQELLARARQQLAQGQAGMIVMRGGRPPGTDQGLMFYAECLSVSQFLMKRQGAPVIGRIATGLAAKRDLSTILEQEDRLPHDFVALEAAWLEWVRSRENAAR